MIKITSITTKEVIHASNANNIKEAVLEVFRKDCNLSNAYLSHYDLSYAHLIGVNFCNAYMIGINLYHADLIKANLSEADMREANLSKSCLSNAYMCNTDLTNANLSYADLHGVNFEGANLSGANLLGADLNGSNLSNIIINKNTFGIAINCPEKGSFIGYKKIKNKLVTLLILDNSKRSSATSYKCRASKVKCLEIEGGLNEITSDYDTKYIFKVNKITEVPQFDDNRWKEFSAGIHFFMSKEMAMSDNNPSPLYIRDLFCA